MDAEGGLEADRCGLSEQELVALHQAARAHRVQLTASKLCGCFRCLAVFGHAEIRKWTQHKNSALCPRCDAEAVIGDASWPGLTRQTLEIMHQRWFER